MPRLWIRTHNELLRSISGGLGRFLYISLYTLSLSRTGIAFRRVRVFLVDTPTLLRTLSDLPCQFVRACISK
jgi:hypothetical protein